MKKIAIISSVAFLAFSACETSVPAPKGPYPTQIKAAFTQGCIKGSMNSGETKSSAEQFCGCMINSIETNVPLSIFVRDVSQNPTKWSLKSPYLDIGLACYLK